MVADTTFQKESNPIIMPSIIFFLLIVMAHMLFVPMNDDVAKAPIFLSLGFADNLYFWFTTQHFRLSAMFFMWLFTLQGWIWFLIANTAVWMILYFFITKTFIENNNDKKAHWFCMFAILCFPMAHFASAGHMATSLGYLWPTSFALVAGFGIKKSLQGRAISLWEYPIYFCSLFIALNAEQMAGYMFGLLAFLQGYYFFTNKKINVYLLLQLFFSLIMLALHFHVLRNVGRIDSDVNIWFYSFAMYGFIERVQFGYAYTLSHFLLNRNWVFLVFSGLVYTAVHVQHSDRVYRTIAVVPLALSTMFSIFSELLNKPVLSYLSGFGHPLIRGFGHAAPQVVNIFNYDRVNNYLLLVLLGIVLVCVFVSLYLCFSDKPHLALVCIAIVSLGLATGFILGFTATIWASAERVFTFAYFSFIVCSVLVFQRVCSLNFKHELRLLSGVGVLGLTLFFLYWAGLVVSG